MVRSKATKPRSPAGTDAPPRKATVDQLDGEVVVLDVEGHAVKLPREFFPGDVREGDGFTLALARAPEARDELARSVADRLAALTGAGTAAKK